MQHDTTNFDPVGSVFRRMGVDATSADEPPLRWEPLIWFSLIIASVTFIQRFSIPYDEGQFGFGFLFCILITIGLFFSGRLTVDPTRMILYTVAISGCIATLFFKRIEISVTSLLMLFVMYFAYSFSMKMRYHHYLIILSRFQDIILFCAWCGLIQFCIQFVLSPDFMFPFDLILPESVLTPGFNLKIPIAENLTYLKSTGFWFLEPAVWSQFLAIAVLIELRHFNRIKRLAFYLGSIALCFSGTGPTLLITVGAVLVIAQGRFGVMFLAILGIASVFIFKDVFPFSVFYDRLSDFSNAQASGSGRFIATYWVIGDLLYEGRYEDLFWGFGPGQLSLIISNTDYFVQDSSWFKMLLEYGLFGSIFFFTFFLISLFRNSPDKIISLACLVQFMLLGGYLLSFYVHFLYLVIAVWPTIIPDEDWDESGDFVDPHDEIEMTDDPGEIDHPEPIHTQTIRRAPS